MRSIAIRKALLSKLGEEAYNEFAEAIDASELSTIESIEDKFERRLVEEISNAKNEIIKWVVTLILGQTLAITGIFIGLMKFFK